MMHSVRVEREVGGYRPTCASCNWIGCFSRHNDRAVCDALEHQIIHVRAA